MPDITKDSFMADRGHPYMTPAEVEAAEAEWEAHISNDEIRTEYHAACEAEDRAADGDERGAAVDRRVRAYAAWTKAGRP